LGGSDWYKVGSCDLVCIARSRRNRFPSVVGRQKLEIGTSGSPGPRSGPASFLSERMEIRDNTRNPHIAKAGNAYLASPTSGNLAGLLLIMTDDNPGELSDEAVGDEDEDDAARLPSLHDVLRSLL
jgi:hypothetical protein